MRSVRKQKVNYDGVACYTDSDCAKLENEPFKKHFCVNFSNQKIGYGYYKFKLNEIDKILERNPELCYIRRGHKIYKYENGQPVFQNSYIFTAKQQYLSFKRCYKNIEHYNSEYSGMTDEIVVNRKTDIFGFKRLRYCSGKANYTMPFALYRPKKTKEKLPLVIFLHGYTNGGEENIIPFTECFGLVSKIKRRKRENPCMILVPSIPKYSGYFTPADGSGGNNFEENFNGLFNKLLNEYPIDKNRIYIIGCSNGAGGVWSQLRLHPERYAAAIPMMGWCDTLTDEYFNSIKNVAVWAVHAENDDNVRIGDFGNGLYGSDYLVEGLKKAGSEKVKYTRYKEHGHNAAQVFMRKENYLTWLFEQKK